MKKRLISFAAVAVIMASCSSEDVLEVNPKPAGQPLSFSIAVGHTRATETKIGNLGNFKVVAKGVHPSGGVFDTFLIGSASDGDEASKDKNTTWTLTKKEVYWPTSVDNALFWAWTCSQEENGKKSAVLPSGTFEFSNTSSSLQVKDFSPEKADLSGVADDLGVWADGMKQVDFVTAFTQAKKTASVSLNFGHVLSQIDIVAKSVDKAADDHRIVRIKGAWLVNTKDKANLVSGFKWDKEKEEAEHTLNWDSYNFKKGSFSAYGSFYKTPKVLEAKNVDLNLLGENSLMLIPQPITEWDRTPVSETSTNRYQAYILLLCRVELKHKGEQHTDTEQQDADTDKQDDIAIFGDYHYHQQFPVNSSKKFVESEYGFVCVPVGMTFEMGKKYKFILDICGSSSGAGFYPPEADFIKFKDLLPTDKTFTDRDPKVPLTLAIVGRPEKPKDDPDYKQVGDPVLNEPIKFNVEVTGWGEWIDGSGNGNVDKP